MPFMLPGTLSSGQQQRAAIARALCKRPAELRVTSPAPLAVSHPEYTGLQLRLPRRPKLLPLPIHTKIMSIAHSQSIRYKKNLKLRVPLLVIRNVMAMRSAIYADPPLPVL